MKINWFYIFVAVAFTGMLIISITFFRSAGHSSVGITHSKGYKINADKSAQVQLVKVVAGQQVKAGDVLVELTSFSLELELDKLQTKIGTLVSERAEKAKLANAEIAYIRADQGVEIEKLNLTITQTEAELALNKKLLDEYTHSNTEEQTPIDKKIEALKLQRTKYEEAIKIKVQDILQEKATEERLLDNQIELLQRERELLMEEKKNLRKIATVDGVVENVLVKQGEQVAAYTALLSVNPVHPTTVIGYLVGRKEALPIGAEVSVRSHENPKLIATGKIIGYGSVVALPEILQKSTAVTGFGREFFVEIEAQNNFANGERVLIR